MVKNNEEIRLPIGFRFRPTDEEVVVHYLRRRALSLPLPASVISDLPFHVFLSDPWSLPGDLREKRYYFWKRNKGELGHKCSRIIATSSGFWKAIGKEKQIISSGVQNDVVGVRKAWAFYQGKNHPCGLSSKTRWFMHEFQLPHSSQNPRDRTQDWVVCRLFQRKTRPKIKNGEIAPNLGVKNRSYIDFKVEDSFELGPPQPSSPSSTSDISDILVN